MNGELLLSCKIVAAAKLALKENELIHCELSKYEQSISFHFMPRRTLLSSREYKASNIDEWYEKCLSLGLQDIKFLMPVSVEDRALLGYANTAQNSIICYYKHGKVTFFTARWHYDDALKHWIITYTEHSWKRRPHGKPQFEDNTDCFAAILDEIEMFAREINFNGYGDIFHKAKGILTDDVKSVAESNITLPPNHNRLFMSASLADVFGAMGSWNDSPPWYAHEKGLDAKYNELSAELLKQLRLAVLYAINQW